MATDAPVVLVDEPFAHLDASTARRLREDLVSVLHDRRRTVVWVTHDREEAETVGHRTLVMDGAPHGSWQITDDRYAESLALTGATAGEERCCNRATGSTGGAAT